ncbi:MAG: hypothetical protein GX613_16885 [Chloroflexi bacterium]|nr:hypothetical protein [Chloroflexota bacterium]
MSYRLYLCDLPANCLDEQIVALLQPHGEVQAVEWEPLQEGVKLRRAVVVLETPRFFLGIVGQMNRESIGERPVIASPACPPDGPLEFTRRGLESAKHISLRLKERRLEALTKVQVIVAACGPRFTVNMMKRALKVYSSGGMLLPDGSRRRTLGGIFFVLTKEYVTPDMKRYIFHQTKRIEKAQIRAAKQGLDPQSIIPIASAAPPETLPVAETAPESVAERPALPPKPAPKTPRKPADPAPKRAQKAPQKPLTSETDSQTNPLDLARQRLDTLRKEMHAAQSELEAVKAGQVSKATGVFSLMKQVVDAQKAIDALLAEHPALKQ